MRFTDGAWMMQPGVTVGYATEGIEVYEREREITVLVATRPIRHRGDTLQGPTLTVRLTSPREGIIGVRIDHFQGVVDRGPHFHLEASDDHAIEHAVDEEFVVFRSGSLTAKLNLKNYRLTFSEGDRFLTEAEFRSTGYAVDGAGDAYVHEQLALSVGENVYGLGERFTAFVKNGQSVEMWNRDGGTDSEQAYKNVPFYLSNRGYGVFVNHSGRVRFEVGTEKVSRMQFAAPGESLEYYVIAGPAGKEVLGRYTELTGKPALPPAWSFGLWLTTSFTTNYDEETVTSFIKGMSDRDLPLHVFHFDCFWMRGFHWTDFEWDPKVFPDPVGMLKRLHDLGLKVCVWINPYIAQASTLFREGLEGGFLLKKPNGDVWQWDLWQPGMGIVDFTNPDACKWFASKLEALLDAGVDAFKTDFGERIPTDVVYFDGSDPERMHNYYSQLYNEVCFDVLTEKRGESEAVLFARSATAGGQKCPVHWGGDCWSTFEAMAESLRGGLSLGLSGFGFWSHDIGGFEGLPPAALYKRWVAFGLLSSHSRLHGSSSYRVPWLYDDEAVDTLRFFTKLKCRLMPYLFAQAVQTVKDGVPLMRVMLLEFPSDPGCDGLDRQYMLGENLLVAPIFSYSNRASYYVPAGSWVSLIDGRRLQGPKWIEEEHGFLSMPLLVRENSIVAMGTVDSKPDYDYSDGVTFAVNSVGDGEFETSLVDTKGDVVGVARARRSGQDLEIKVDGLIKNWKVLLLGSENTPAMEGQQHELGFLIGPFDTENVKIDYLD